MEKTDGNPNSETMERYRYHLRWVLDSDKTERLAPGSGDDDDPTLDLSLVVRHLRGRVYRTCRGWCGSCGGGFGDSPLASRP